MNIGEGFSQNERETIIRISADQKEWEVYSAIQKHCRKLDKIGILTADLGHSKLYRVPYKAITFRKLMEITKYQRDKMASRMVLARGKRN